LVFLKTNTPSGLCLVLMLPKEKEKEKENENNQNEKRIDKRINKIQ